MICSTCSSVSFRVGMIAEYPSTTWRSGSVIATRR